ncbi:MAG TPA: ABC transporter permease [Candidatus Binatia bacterium]|nr:ABC transporter permease [Candidatus Binatia bacterium]
MSRQFFQIAWRNLWRNPRRTLLTIAAIALGYTMLLFFACLLEGFRQQLIETGTSLGLSHIQVHAPDYYPDRSIYKTLGGQGGTDVEGLLAALAADPRVRAAAPRVYGYGLISCADHSAGAEILGVVPVREQQLTTLHTRLIAGSYLTEPLPKGVVVGDKLATAIGAGVGSEVVLVTQAADGSMGNDLYTVVGILRTGLETLDRGVVLMSLASLQELLSLAPGRVHEVGVAVSDAVAATPVAAALEARLGNVLPVRVRAWPELVPDLASYVQLHRSSVFLIFFIVFLLAVIGIMNTMLMAVFERTRELGMLMALGMRPVQVISLILAEAGGLIGVSLVLGGGIALPLLWYLQVHGLDLHSFMGEVSIVGAVIDPLWYGRQDFPAYGQAALGFAVTAVVSALYPALRAARLRPVEAIHKA